MSIKMSIHGGQSGPDVSGGLSLYAGDAACGTVSRFVVSLTMHVRSGILERAVNDVLPLFPHLYSCPVRTDGGYVLRKDMSPVRVFRQEVSRGGMTNVCGGMDGRLFRVSCAGKTIFFDIHLAMLDERGMAAFAKSVVFRYIQLAGYPISNDGNVRTLTDGEIHVSEEDPMEHIADIPASRPAWYMDAKAFLLQHDIPAGPDHITQIRVPLAKLRSYAKDYSGLPVTFIAPLVSHAVYERYRQDMESGEYVVASISVNLRQYFPTLSFRPFSTAVTLAYNRRLGEYPFNTILMSQKKLLEAQLKPDALAYNAGRRLDDMERLSSASGLEAKAHMAEKMASMEAARSTYMIRGAGNVGMPESMLRYVTEFYPIFTPVRHDFVVSMVVLRNEAVLTFSERNGADGSFSRRVAELMNENEICAYVSDEFDMMPIIYKLP
ncbi:MAG: hypothetical protein IAC23_07690 [Bacteroidetes bacterium]|uniref:Uncharacterized protein n=1 Tax=Candidatus Cryptobacteroides merdavium TaxID=2840769 RepID=A0A9D9ECQ0_9BACT|nr:hypothetical protein [Candidatus Cryptobacteroides merdavium]